MLNLEELKKLAETDTFLVEMRDVFFEAMNAGYAAEGKPKKGSIAELPGSKTITYTIGPWVVLDVYQVTPISSFSGGTTHIWYKGVEVWMMQYFGKYEEVAIPCLKAALRDAYSRKEFRGGRGPHTFKHTGFVYRNPISQLDFEEFYGAEEILDERHERRKVLGWHRFQGGLMI